MNWRNLLICLALPFRRWLALVGEAGPPFQSQSRPPGLAEVVFPSDAVSHHSQSNAVTQREDLFPSLCAVLVSVNDLGRKGWVLIFT